MAEVGSSKPSGPSVILELLALGPGRLNEKVRGLLLAGGDAVSLAVTGVHGVRVILIDDTSGRETLNVETVSVVHYDGRKPVMGKRNCSSAEVRVWSDVCSN